MPGLSDHERLAMEFALGIADAEDHLLAARRAADDPGFRALVEGWRARFGVLAELAPARAPPPGTLAAIKARIAAIAAARRIVDDAREWHEIVPGIHGKHIAPGQEAGQASGHRSMLLRFAAGAVLPAHRHPGDEICLVLEGAVLSNGVALSAGECQALRAGTRHQPVRSAGGALVFVRLFDPPPAVREP